MASPATPPLTPRRSTPAATASAKATGIEDALCLYRGRDRPRLRQGRHRHHRQAHRQRFGHGECREQRLRLHLRPQSGHPQRRQRHLRATCPRTSRSAARSYIGRISQTQTSTATAGKPYGIAKAYAEPIVGLNLLVGNATGGAAYGGKGEVADGGSISGTATATATGYSATAKAIGLSRGGCRCG